MRDEEEFEIEIYHNGVHFKSPVRGKNRFLKEREFLDRLVGGRSSASAIARPIPDPPEDFYMLDDAQLDAYSAFRRRMKEE